MVLTCAADGSILVHEVNQILEKKAEKSRESLETLEAQYGGGEKEKPGMALGGIDKFKSKLSKLTWEDAAVAGQIENEKVLLIL